MCIRDSLSADEAAPYLTTGRFPGHAQEFETATALALFPENVRQDAMEDQDDKEPLAATAENGQAMLDIIIENTAAHLKAMIDGEDVIRIPDFHE